MYVYIFILCTYIKVVVIVVKSWWRVCGVYYNGYSAVCSVLRELLIASPVLSQYHTERGKLGN